MSCSTWWSRCFTNSLVILLETAEGGGLDLAAGRLFGVQGMSAVRSLGRHASPSVSSSFETEARARGRTGVRARRGAGVSGPLRGVGFLPDQRQPMILIREQRWYHLSTPADASYSLSLESRQMIGCVGCVGGECFEGVLFSFDDEGTARGKHVLRVA